jgi:hypothetical protein
MKLVLVRFPPGRDNVLTIPLSSGENSQLQCAIFSHQFSDKMRHLLRMPRWFSISGLR